MPETKVAVVHIEFKEGMSSADIHIENASPAHLYAAAGLLRYEADKARTAIDFQNLQADRLTRSIMANPRGVDALRNGGRS
jgi:hypothetical protein